MAHTTSMPPWTNNYSFFLRARWVQRVLREAKEAPKDKPPKAPEGHPQEGQTIQDHAQNGPKTVQVWC